MNTNPEHVTNEEADFFRRVAIENGFATLWEIFIKDQPDWQLMTATMSAKQVLCDYQEQLFATGKWARDLLRYED
jgi:hypothetical protein